jgi:hypothetical protein
MISLGLCFEVSEYSTHWAGDQPTAKPLHTQGLESKASVLELIRHDAIYVQIIFVWVSKKQNKL